MRTRYVVESISTALLVSGSPADRFAPGLVVAKAEERRESAAGSETKAASRPGIEVLGVHGDPSPGA